MATARLAHWAYNLTFADLPPDVVRAAVRSFYNWAGCTIGGSRHEAASIAHDTLSPFFGPAHASLLGLSVSADAQHAALLNGIASHVHDYDDTHLDTIIHPTGPVASALLAVAELHAPVRGQDLLLALVAGIEAECKVGLAVWPEHYDVGWHITSTAGSIGAAVAVGKLLGLSPEQLTHAVGLAATQVVGLRDMFGSHTKSFHPGRAAQAGLLAALLAQRGYTSSAQALEAKRGWANVVAATKTDPQAGLQKWIGFGEADVGVGLFTAAAGKGRWEILRNSFKSFPCGIVIHPIIDACIRLHRDMEAKGLNAAHIQTVDVKVHALVLELTGKRTPVDGLQAKFSVYHSGACGLVLGRATPREYEDDVVHDPAIVSVRDKINAHAQEGRGADAASVTVVWQDGTMLEKHVAHAAGSREVPMDDAMLEKKFLGSCAPVLGDAKAKQASAALWGVATVHDVASIIQVLVMTCSAPVATVEALVECKDMDE
ncbi:hypothetical protein VFPBJ_06311 [Purpureocillium lilacinum]|uniref:MmgE/PrpD family protein n=1 Tax=Purpureocillium lilacinum TaxID=33203 RepID=A0A179GK56_PURLI|nr:hypothetical protein VFPBJ_06311 [Purpureocillium lilacinum]